MIPVRPRLLWLGGLVFAFTFYLSYIASSASHRPSIDTLTVIESERRRHEEKLQRIKETPGLLPPLELRPHEQIVAASLPPEPIPPEVSTSELVQEYEDRVSGTQGYYDDMDTMRLNQPDLNSPETFPPELLAPETNFPELFKPESSFPPENFVEPEPDFIDYMERILSQSETPEIIPAEYRGSDELHPDTFLPELNEADFLPSEIPSPGSPGEFPHASPERSSSELRFDFSQTID